MSISPTDEAQRLDSLQELNLLQTPAEERFDRITRITTRSLGVPFSALCLVDASELWMKSTHGMERLELRRKGTFFTDTIQQESLVFIEDLKRNDRFQYHPLRRENPSIQSYVGVPVRTSEKEPVGVLSAFDTKPWSPSEEERDLVKDLASLVESELEREHLHDVRVRLRDQLEEVERRARIDSLTELWNRRGIQELVEAEIQRVNREGVSLGLALMDIDDFKGINDTYGHPAGDAVLEELAVRMRQAVRDYDALGRYGGEEFLVLFPESDRSEAEVVSQRIREQVAREPFETENATLDVSISIGVRVAEAPPPLDPGSVIADADEALYQAKRRGKNRVVFA